MTPDADARSRRESPALWCERRDPCRAPGRDIDAAILGDDDAIGICAGREPLDHPMRVHIDDEKRIIEIARDIEPRSIGRAREQGRINATAGRVGWWPERDAVTQRGRIAPGVFVHAVAIATRGVQRVTVW